MTDTTNMTEAELADYYERTADLSEFEGGEVVKIEPGPKDSIVSVRFAAAELEAVERQAEEVGMKLTAFIRASALSGAQVVDLDRLRKVAAKLVADSQEMGKVVDLPTRRRTETTTSTRGTAAKSAQTGRMQKSSRTTAGNTLGQTATTKAASKATSSRSTSKTAASKAPTKAPASKSTAHPAKKSPLKGKA